MKTPKEAKAETITKPDICVLGAGHGGQAMAGHLAIMGFSVNLYNRGEERLKPIRDMGGIQVTGQVEGFGKLNLITSDPEEAIAGTDLLMVVVPAIAHRSIAERCMAHLKDGQVVLLNPGRTGGALEFNATIRSHGIKTDVIIAEAQTLIYASRLMNPAQVHIFRIKNTIPVAAFPAYKTVEALKVVKQAYHQFVPGDNVLKTSLDNVGAVFHPAITVLNAARIESTRGDFNYYIDGITPSVSLILESLDRERVEVAAALGIRAMPAREWLYVAYDAVGRNLYEAIQNNTGYRDIKAPPTLHHRYILEDVPASLVPIASLGDMLGVDTSTTKTIIQLCSLLAGCDFWKEGRTVDKLGLEGLSVRQIRKLVLEGEL